MIDKIKKDWDAKVRQGLTINKILILKNTYKLLMLEKDKVKPFADFNESKLTHLFGKELEIAKFGGDYPKELYNTGYIFMV